MAQGKFVASFFISRSYCFSIVSVIVGAVVDDSDGPGTAPGESNSCGRRAPATQIVTDVGLVNGCARFECGLLGVGDAR